MDPKKINELIKKYGEGTASADEIRRLTEWYRNTAYQDAEFPDDESETYYSILQRVNEQILPAPGNRSLRYWGWAASVALIMTIGASVYIFRNTEQNGTTGNKGIVKIIPGGNKALLTLSNGKKVSLTDANIGELAIQGGIQITKSKDGQIIYSLNGDKNAPVKADQTSGELAYNMIETPAGGQYQIVLPDGSRVWLNSLSSIRFPVSFAGLKERIVQLSGEGYFEVKHNESVAFRVISRGQITEDIGTAFNINAYGDEAAIRTTLVEGSVKVTSDEMSAQLKPGQQSVVTTKISIKQANVEDAIAWKNGYFRFDDEKLEDIMKNIARWYNIKYVFQDEELKKETYGGATTRFSHISPLLNLMQQTGNADFKISGNTIYISRKNN